ncbi:hypothetical protein WJX81_001188 [Elliptochloris bilobata]|uniref:ribulose-phosphate 3-epimerase n=1 Tax=Elliptochloris bilobata TaxID=381761 RepID=A0AAW1PZU2_9CHLO
MDGHFVNNWTFGPCLVAAVARTLRQHSAIAPPICDCHLYATAPQDWVEELQRAGASLFTFHLEALGGGQCSPQGAWPRSESVVKLTRRIREAGMAAGIALVPSTPAEAVEPYASAGDIDLVLLLSVEPGFGGQAFQRGVLPKAAYLRRRFPDLHIQMDGGIGPGETVEAAAEAGVNIVVAGSAIFGRSDERRSADDMRQTIEAMRRSLCAAGQPPDKSAGGQASGEPREGVPGGRCSVLA